MLDFETSNSKSEVSKSNSNYVTSEGAVSHDVLYYQFNLSPLIVTKKGFMLIIILSDYQVSTALKNTESERRF